MRTALTTRQRVVYDCVVKFISVHIHMPTMRELADALDISPTGVRCHLEAMRRKGWIEWEPGKSRTIRPVA